MSIDAALTVVALGAMLQGGPGAGPQDQRGPLLRGLTDLSPLAVAGAMQGGTSTGPGGGADAAATERSAQNNPLENEMTPQLDAAVSRGLARLAAMQRPDGSFGDPLFGRSVAVTALAGIAFMADGNVPGRGAYGENVRLALEYVLRNSSEAGLLATDSTSSPMYGHGFATLFLGEVYGMTQGTDNELAERTYRALVRAVRLIETTQNNEGGWRYNPVPFDADTSVTICQIMALRAARNAGLEVSKDVIDKAVEYVRACQNPDGGFRYQGVPGPSAWPRSGAGVASLQYAGIYQDRAIDDGLDYLLGAALPIVNNTTEIHYYYGIYYVNQAMFLAGGSSWRDWWPAVRRSLLVAQRNDGSWDDNSTGSEYATAMALIVLQMPKRYLPIFQK